MVRRFRLEPIVKTFGKTFVKIGQKFTFGVTVAGLIQA
jgi:hypothetical protein